jgi:hypothetical protein
MSYYFTRINFNEILKQHAYRLSFNFIKMLKVKYCDEDKECNLHIVNRYRYQTMSKYAKIALTALLTQKTHDDKYGNISY